MAPSDNISSSSDIPYKMYIKINKSGHCYTKIDCLNHKLAKIVENQDHFLVTVDSAER